jgi:predicted AAA+ superfamily ATPase
VDILKNQRPTSVIGREVPRELLKALPAGSAQAIALTGVRRSGKSVLQAQLMDAGGGVYCNLEDTRLYGLSPEDFPALISALESLSSPASPIFLDEVQEVREWERLVRALLDHGRGVCLTGSNASLLSRELGTKLTGRHLSFEVFPFNYREYLAYGNLAPGAESLGSYLDDGGFPVYLRERFPQVLQELLRDVVQRDIAQRRGLRETRHVMNLALFLLANTGTPFSLQDLARSLSIPAVAQTSRYVEYLQDAYLLFALPKFSPSFRRRVVTPPKYYAIDNGLRRANSPQSTPDIGHRLENLVYLALRGTGGALTYAGERNRWECDFVTEAEAIQVCAELTSRNQGREVEGIVQASSLPGRKRRALILTLNQKDRLVERGVSIEVWPVWEWLMEVRP